MYKRFRDSIAFPETILNYRKDSIFRVLFFLLVYATLMTLPVIIDVATFDQIPLSHYNAIKENMHSESFACEIIDYTVVCDTDTSVKFIDNYINIDVYVVSGSDIDFSQYNTNTTNLILYENQIHVLVAGIHSTEPIRVFGDAVNGLDFTTISDDFDAFSHDVIIGAQDIALNTKGYWGSIMIGSYVFVNLLLTLLFAFFTAIIIKTRFKMIPFKQTFVFGAYVSSLSFVALVLMNLMGNFVLFMMIIILVNSRQMGRLMMAINQVIKNKS